MIRKILKGESGTQKYSNHWIAECFSANSKLFFKYIYGRLKTKKENWSTEIIAGKG